MSVQLPLFPEFAGKQEWIVEVPITVPYRIHVYCTEAEALQSAKELLSEEDLMQLDWDRAVVKRAD
jgi:hypothetical protein